MDILTFIHLVLVGIVVVVAVVVGQRMAERRRKALTTLAGQFGFQFAPDRQEEFDSWHPHGVFHRGSSRSAYNLMRGSLDVKGTPFATVMGDYRYTVQSGKHRSTRHFSFLLIRPPWTPLPNLYIRPEHWGDKIMGAIGFDDIDFESEEFSRAFLVKSPDKRFAYAVVHQRMMEYLMQVTGPELELLDGECLFLAGGSTWTVEEFRSHVGWARRFFALWPEHLVRQLAGQEGVT